MINNRQNGRRRGRGGGGQRSPGGGQGQRDSGNRIDSRARGNAAQLLEKYRNMARDAQLSGDRVNTEYYLQFADHYFRVLADQRGRFEEQNQSRRPRDDFDPYDDFGDEGEPLRAEEQQQQQPRGEDNRREERGNGRERRFSRREEQRGLEGEPATEETFAAAPVETVAEAAPAEEAPRPRRGRPRRVPEADTGEAVIDANRLPPSLGAVPPEGVIASEGEPAKAPRPRRRRTADAEAGAN